MLNLTSTFILIDDVDYLDSAKEFRQKVLLWLGYFLIGLSIIIASLILVNLAYGYNLGKNGNVIQNGLVYFSSQPNPASIYLNGKKQSQKTNTRLLLPSGIYQVKISRSGYISWQRTVDVNGGYVEHFDYPLLIPAKLNTKTLISYKNAPGFASQSPDRRWLVVQRPGSDYVFYLYDLSSPKVTETNLNLPANLITKAVTSSSYVPVEWSDDNQHLLLEHNYDGKNEYILLDRTDPSQSINLNETLNLTTNPIKISLNNKKYDQYYIYGSDGSLSTASLSNPTLTKVTNDHVLAYKSYGGSTLLYVTDSNAPANKVYVKMLVNSTTYTIRELNVSSVYLLDLTSYNGTLYVVVGASAENRVYIYADPVGQINNSPTSPPLTTWTLYLPSPNYVAFSANAQFIMAENGSRFSVYDLENSQGYNYSSAYPLDDPQLNATWMDGDRLVYDSGGKVVMQDYDYTNVHQLVKANAVYPIVFSPDYKYLYSFQSTNNQVYLRQTPLLTTADL